VFVSHEIIQWNVITSYRIATLEKWSSKHIWIIALVLIFTFAQSSRAQQAQQAENTSQNHYAEAQMALLTFFYFMDKCQKGDNGACMLAAMAYNQYVALMQTGSQSRTTADLSATLGKKDDKNPTLINGSTVNGATVAGRTVGDALEKLKAKGIVMGPNGTMSVNGGPMVPASSFGTDSGMMAAGLSAHQAADLKAKMDEMKDKNGANMNKALAGDMGGGGGGSRAPEPPEASVAGAAKAGSKAGVSGLSKNLGNDKIGVAGDDIFKMISRRYKANESSFKE